MTVPVTPFLRNALHLDAAVSGAAGLLMLAGGGLLAPLLDLPQTLLFWAGAIIVLFGFLLLWTARQTEVRRIVVIDIIGLNVIWVVASFGILLSGAVAPNLLGYAFVIAQALAVGLFAALQLTGLRRATAGEPA